MLQCLKLPPHPQRCWKYFELACRGLYGIIPTRGMPYQTEIGSCLLTLSGQNNYVLQV